MRIEIHSGPDSYGNTITHFSGKRTITPETPPGSIKGKKGGNVFMPSCPTKPTNEGLKVNAYYLTNEDNADVNAAMNILDRFLTGKYGSGCKPLTLDYIKE
jgi:hypothetical protein